MRVVLLTGMLTQAGKTHVLLYSRRPSGYALDEVSKESLQVHIKHCNKGALNTLSIIDYM